MGKGWETGLGEGRVKGPLPDGLLTPWCPVSPIPAGTLGGNGKIVPVSLPTPSPDPREIRREKTSPALFLGSRGKRRPDF